MMTEDVARIDAAFFEAMQCCDADSMGALMAEDCVYIHSFGTRDSKPSYLEKVRGGFFVYHRVDVTRERIITRGDVAVVVGTMSGTVTAGGVDRRLNNVRSSVWAREGDGWKLVLFQPTPWLDR
jgi:ketosteroid isomerase-like protein